MQLLRTRLYLSQSDWWTFMRWEDKQERRARSGHTSLIFSKVSSSSQCSCTSWDRPSEIPLILLVADYMSRSPPSLLASRHHTAPMVAIVAKHGPRNQHVNMSTCTWILDIYKRFSEALAPFPWVNITSVPAAARFALAWKVVCPLVVSMGHCSGTRSMQSGRQGSPSPGTHHNTKVWSPFGQVELISHTCGEN